MGQASTAATEELIQLLEARTPCRLLWAMECPNQKASSEGGSRRRSLQMRSMWWTGPGGRRLRAGYQSAVQNHDAARLKAQGDAPTREQHVVVLVKLLEDGDIDALESAHHAAIGFVQV